MSPTETETLESSETREPRRRPYEAPVVTRFGTFAELTMVIYKCT